MDGYKILFTGDINDKITPLFDGFEIPEGEIDVLITESTNGCREVIERETINSEFIADVRRTLDLGNKVIIPFCTWEISRIIDSTYRAYT